MRKYSENQLARAKKIDIITYLKQNGYAVCRVAEDIYKLTEQDLYVKGGMWCWFSHYQMGDIIGFLTKYEGRTFREAMERLLDENPCGEYVRETQEEIKKRLSGGNGAAEPAENREE